MTPEMQNLPIRCECGCGQTRPKYAKNGTTRRFISGHQARCPSPKQIAHRQSLVARNGCTPGNKDKSYVMGSKDVYANSASWMKAMKRLFVDRCMRCGWDDVSVDAHHIVPKSRKGPHRISNGVLLCLNCHRRAHRRSIPSAELHRVRESAERTGALVTPPGRNKS